MLFSKCNRRLWHSNSRRNRNNQELQQGGRDGYKAAGHGKQDERATDDGRWRARAARAATTDEQRQKQIMLAVDSGDLELALRLKKAR